MEDSVEQFKEDFIYSDIIKTEVEEKSMLKWMECLTMHTFQPRHFESEGSENSPLRQAYRLVDKGASQDDDNDKTTSD